MFTTLKNKIGMWSSLIKLGENEGKVSLMLIQIVKRGDIWKREKKIKQIFKHIGSPSNVSGTGL